MELLEEHHCFEGRQQRWRHDSAVLNCAMTFSIFLPPSNGAAKPPVLYWLSGLTCNDENFTTKAGAQRVAAELGARSVAFPAVSGGIFGWAMADVARIAVAAVRDWDRQHPDSGVDLVRFVLFSPDATKHFEAALS